ncbi:MAG: glycosyltransferase family 4 protein [Polaromonas sp.]|nr:glycosyltransferase family 4 protein [Polaromonas sp.]
MCKFRILIIHNAYQQRGGEDAVVEAELEMLRGHGHPIEVFLKHNDELKTTAIWKAAADTVWSRSSVSSLREIISRFQPDVVHFHNTFPMISPSAYWAVRAAGLPVVQTLHNFRLHCLQGTYLRKGKVCEDCIGNVPWRGVTRGCYRASIPQSAVLAGMLTVHRTVGTWQNKVTRYIALNEFCRCKLIEGGLPAERVVIKPNFVDFEAPTEALRQGFLFVGRLSVEKGIAVLVKAMKGMDAIALRIAGTGPEAAILEGAKGISALGRLTSQSVRNEMGQASALVFPSIWYEGFPITIVEAFASRLPVIASRLGGMPEWVTDGVTGLLFEPGNAQDLAKKMSWAQQHPDAMAEMGRKARALYEAKFTAEQNYPQLIKIYQDAISEVKSEVAG